MVQYALYCTEDCRYYVAAVAAVAAAPRDPFESGSSPDPDTDPDPQHCSKWYSMHCTVLNIADTMWLLLPLWPLLSTASLVSCKAVQVNQLNDLQFCIL